MESRDSQDWMRAERDFWERAHTGSAMGRRILGPAAVLFFLWLVRSFFGAFSFQ
jgi:hypothetical protein